MVKRILKNKNKIAIILVAVFIFIYAFMLFKPVVDMQSQYSEMNAKSEVDEDPKEEVVIIKKIVPKQEVRLNKIIKNSSIDSFKAVNKEIDGAHNAIKIKIDKSKKLYQAYLKKPFYGEDNAKDVVTAKVGVDIVGKVKKTLKPSIKFPKVLVVSKPVTKKKLKESIVIKKTPEKINVVNETFEEGEASKPQIRKLYFKPKYRFNTIRMYNLNTGEHLATVFYQNGEYSTVGLKKINKFLRDYRTGGVKKIDPKLIMLVYKISRRLRYNGYIHVISGYRSVKTNNKLRKAGRHVAKKSMHSKGKAIDIRFPGVSTKRLRNIALSYRAGGVGYYPHDGFVHVDTGPLRKW